MTGYDSTIEGGRAKPVFSAKVVALRGCGGTSGPCLPEYPLQNCEERPYADGPEPWAFVEGHVALGGNVGKSVGQPFQLCRRFRLGKEANDNGDGDTDQEAPQGAVQILRHI